MLPPPEQLDSDALAHHMTLLNDEQTSDLIARVDAAEVASQAKKIDMGASAHWYATALGWPVFPLTPRGKKPLTLHGFKDASTDPAKLAYYWEKWPDANIGVPTGSRDTGGCGFDVLDVDGVDGIAAWTQLKHAKCPPDCSAEQFCPAPGPFDIRARAFTPGDGVDRKPGRHLYLPASGRGNTTRIQGLSIDYRGAGGYVVAPPSVGISGVRYAWLTLPTPEPPAPAAA